MLIPTRRPRTTSAHTREVSSLCIMQQLLFNQRATDVTQLGTAHLHPKHKRPSKELHGTCRIFPTGLAFRNLYLFRGHRDRKSTRLNSSHLGISYAVFC